MESLRGGFKFCNLGFKKGHIASITTFICDCQQFSILNCFLTNRNKKLVETQGVWGNVINKYVIVVVNVVI